MSRRGWTKFAILIASTGVAFSSAARADTQSLYSDVVCQKGLDIVLVRFAPAANDDPPVFRQLPPTVDRGLSKHRPSRRQNCTMGKGWQVRIRSGQKQAYAYGYGGGDPPAFFSLWIAGRKVLSRKQWKPGYGEDPGSWLVGLAIRPNSLTYCSVPESMDAPDKGDVVCKDEPLHLARYKFDRIEYAPAGTRPPVGSVLVLPGSPDPSLCREYLRLRKRNWPETYMMVDSAKIFRPVSALPELRLAEATIEVSPGVRRKLINWGGDSHYFDGDLMFVTPVSANPRAVLKWEMLDLDQGLTGKLPSGWFLISGGQSRLYPQVSLRYVHFDTQKIRGRIYLLAQPTNREEKPTAILVQPLASGYRAVCQIQRIEPNF